MLAGRAADAEREARRSVAVAEQRFGADRSETAYMLFSAADLLKDRLATAELRAMSERAYAIATCTGDAPLAAGAAVVRAYALEREGRFAEAEVDVRRALPSAAVGAVRAGRRRRPADRGRGASAGRAGGRGAATAAAEP
jgi:hypothetical protein